MLIGFLKNIGECRALVSSFVAGQITQYILQSMPLIADSRTTMAPQISGKYATLGALT